MSDDRRLAQRVAGGERKACEELVDSYGPRVHRLVRRYVDNPCDAEDVTQEIFIDIYRCIGRFRGESALMTWVYRIAVNHCLRFREKMKPDSMPLDDIQESDGNWKTNPLPSAMKSETSSAVRSAVAELSPLHRDVVILHELHGLSYQECAAALQVPVGTVKSRLSNAFRRLRGSLSAYAPGQAPVVCPDPIHEIAQ